MKQVIKILVVFFLIINFSDNNSFAQESCKVLKAGIDSSYLGACKKDLAHGVGEAWGYDHYYGEFKRGLPHGKGVYEYKDGSVYKGSLSKGLRHGNGDYLTTIGKVDTCLSGIWLKDRYVGQKPDDQGYSVIRKVNVERYRIIRVGDGNKITVKLMMTTTANPGISAYEITGNTGNEFTYTGHKGYENIQFPFEMRVRFQKSNKMNTGRLDVLLDINFAQPGEWRIELF